MSSTPAAGLPPAPRSLEPAVLRLPELAEAPGVRRTRGRPEGYVPAHGQLGRIALKQVQAAGVKPCWRLVSIGTSRDAVPFELADTGSE
jgi:hypothetical protein